MNSLFKARQLQKIWLLPILIQLGVGMMLTSQIISLHF